MQLGNTFRLMWDETSIPCMCSIMGYVIWRLQMGHCKKMKASVAWYFSLRHIEDIFARVLSPEECNFSLLWSYHPYSCNKLAVYTLIQCPVWHIDAVSLNQALFQNIHLKHFTCPTKEFSHLTHRIDIPLQTAKGIFHLNVCLIYDPRLSQKSSVLIHSSPSEG